MSQGRARKAFAALVALAMAGLFVNIVYGTGIEASHRHSAAGTERGGIAFAVPQVRLLETLAATRTQVVAGAKVDTGALAAALAAAGAAYQPDPELAPRWLDLRTRVTALVARPGTGAPAAQNWADAADVSAGLLDAVGDAAGLRADPDPATQDLVEMALRDLPALLIAAGRSADVATLADGQPLPVGPRAELAVHRRTVADAAARIDTATAVTGGEGLTAPLDAFQAAVAAFAAPPAPTDPDGDGYPANLPSLARNLQAAAAALAVAVLARADVLVALRQAEALGAEHHADEIALLMLAGALLLVWLLTPSRRRVDDAESGAVPDGEPDRERPATVDTGSLIDARDLLLEELIHVGRGVRTRDRSNDDDAQ